MGWPHMCGTFVLRLSRGQAVIYGPSPPPQSSLLAQTIWCDSWPLRNKNTLIRQDMQGVRDCLSEARLGQTPYLEYVGCRQLRSTGLILQYIRTILPSKLKHQFLGNTLIPGFMVSIIVHPFYIKPTCLVLHYRKVSGSKQTASVSGHSKGFKQAGLPLAIILNDLLVVLSFFLILQVWDFQMQGHWLPKGACLC